MPRHTTLTWVERTFGYATARTYAGHHTRKTHGTTATYVKANLHEIAAALSALTREPHPLLTAEPTPSPSNHHRAGRQPHATGTTTHHMTPPMPQPI
ncbi:hypothetical protein [Nocardia anaemiae]|uniref:hypothetical protein n=1 Tax=Nocardia anaemiae TaxID=263910 RepID=UPI0007A4F13A|nr:hypothetical protein [Nocardia anaemiae]